MQVLTQVVLLPIVTMLLKFFEKRLEQHFENERIKKENKKKEEEFKNAQGKDVEDSFNKLP